MSERVRDQGFECPGRASRLTELARSLYWVKNLVAVLWRSDRVWCPGGKECEGLSGTLTEIIEGFFSPVLCGYSISIVGWGVHGLINGGSFRESGVVE